MKRGIIWGVLLLLLCSCAAREQKSDTEWLAQSIAEGEWANVRDYGAVGDARYHHPLGEKADEWLYWVGHFSQMATTEYQVPYIGTAENDEAYKVIPDSLLLLGRQIRLSKVNPGHASYTPAAGDIVVEYTAVDLEASVPATDDSAAFEAALAVGDGRLYLPEGDYLISQLTAVKIKDIRGLGKIWLKEWMGGTIYYLVAGISDVLTYKNYGWIDETHFHDQIWRDMHWVTCQPAVYRWTDSDDFYGIISPRMEFDFDETRDTLNVWLTVQPAVEEDAFPDSVTVCIADMSANFSLKGSKKWHAASEGGIGGGLFHLTWNGMEEELPDSAWKDYGDWVEITLKKEDFFRCSVDGEKERWALHCWSLQNRSIGKHAVEFVCNSARVWLKEEGVDGCLMCDIGGDMRTTWENRNVKEGYIMESCDSAVKCLTSIPQTFHAYTVSDELFDQYAPFPS